MSPEAIRHTRIERACQARSGRYLDDFNSLFTPTYAIGKQGLEIRATSGHESTLDLHWGQEKTNTKRSEKAAGRQALGCAVIDIVRCCSILVF